VKILGDGANHFHTAVNLIVSRASKSAIKAIEKAGGKVVCRHYNELALRDLKKGDMKHKLASPMREKDILFYSNWRSNRGYIGMPAELRAHPAFSGPHLDVAEHLLPGASAASPSPAAPTAAIPPPPEIVVQPQPST